jgi:hypothetical protein
MTTEGIAGALTQFCARRTNAVIVVQQQDKVHLPWM